MIHSKIYAEVYNIYEDIYDLIKTKLSQVNFPFALSHNLEAHRNVV